jgi:hypothetical protein
VPVQHLKQHCIFRIQQPDHVSGFSFPFSSTAELFPPAFDLRGALSPLLSVPRSIAVLYDPPFRVVLRNSLGSLQISPDSPPKRDPIRAIVILSARVKKSLILVICVHGFDIIAQKTLNNPYLTLILSSRASYTPIMQRSTQGIRDNNAGRLRSPLAVPYIKTYKACRVFRLPGSNKEVPRGA